MAKIIDGKALAQKHEEALKEKISHLAVVPHAVSFFDPVDPPSVTFTRMKQNKASELSIVLDAIEITPEVSTNVVATLVEGFNTDTDTHGLMFQLPLPKHLRSHQDYLLNLIKGKKDIDGLKTASPYLPATVKGVESILESLGDDLIGVKYYAVVGSEGMIGKEMVHTLLTLDGEDVIEVDQKKTESSLDDIKQADIVISCVGKNNLIKPEHIKKGAVLIDVGLGDFDPGCYEKASAYTPVKGGVGPMTIISLMENIIDAVV